MCFIDVLDKHDMDDDRGLIRDSTIQMKIIRWHSERSEFADTNPAE